MFSPRSIALDSSAESQLQRFAIDIGERRVLIRGYADRSEGTNGQALDLSRDRAAVVYEHLQAYGVRLDQMTVEASGFSAEGTEPVEVDSHNRRVDVIAYAPSR